MIFGALILLTEMMPKRKIKILERVSTCSMSEIRCYKPNVLSECLNSLWLVRYYEILNKLKSVSNETRVGIKAISH